MNVTKMLKSGVMFMAIVGLAGCATTANRPIPAASASTPSTVFEHPIAKVQQAAVTALTVIGCKVTRQEPTYVECMRPNKVGLFVGSGGEMVRVWLEEQGPERTSIKVKTAKSFVGIVGQKNWDRQVLDEIASELGK